jgi:hypothetical protein
MSISAISADLESSQNNCNINVGIVAWPFRAKPHRRHVRMKTTQDAASTGKASLPQCQLNSTTCVSAQKIAMYSSTATLHLARYQEAEVRGDKPICFTCTPFGRTKFKTFFHHHTRRYSRYFLLSDAFIAHDFAPAGFYVSDAWPCCRKLALSFDSYIHRSEPGVKSPNWHAGTEP